jgi:hypothetical protein
MAPGLTASQELHLLALPPEIQMSIFYALLNIKTAIALRSTCRKFDGIYRRIEPQFLIVQRDRLTAPFAKFYNFLLRLKLPDDTVLHPPSAGWTDLDLNLKTSHVQSKTQFAMDVLRHMSFIDSRYRAVDMERNIGLRTSVVNYVDRSCWGRMGGFRVEEPAILWKLEQPATNNNLEAPLSTRKHILMIAESKYGNGTYLMLDTITGLIAEVPREGPIRQKTPQAYCDDRIAALAELKEVFIPDQETIVLSDMDHEHYDADEMERQGEPGWQWPRPFGSREDGLWVRHLHRKFGWPGEDWDKEGCLSELSQFNRRQRNEMIGGQPDV